jgi:glycosyltransferase involved in cell wall biosynthesis
VHLGRLRAALIEQGFEIKSINEGSAIVKDAYNLRYESPFRYILLIMRSDLIHIHSSNSYLMALHCVAARLFRKRIIITLHSGRKIGFSRLLQKAAAHLASLTIAVSDEIATNLSGRLVTIPAFIKPEPWECSVPAAFEEILLNARLKGKKTIITNVTNAGTFEGHEIYGIDIVVRAMENALLRERFELVIFVSNFVGREQYVQRLRAQIRQSRLEDCCHVFEYDGPMAGAIAEADLLVRATNTDGDSLSVREALYFGTPVIASDCTQRPPGVILFASRDAGSLAEKLASLNSGGMPIPATKDFLTEICAAYRATWNLGN